MHTRRGVASLAHEPFDDGDNKTRLAKTSITIVHTTLLSSREEMVCNAKREQK